MALPDIGEGTTIEVNDGGGGDYAAFGRVVNIDPPAAEVMMVESKRLDLTNRRKVYVNGLEDPGKWSFQCEKTAADLARAVAIRGTEKNFRITVQDTSDIVRVIPSKVTKVKEDPITAEEIQTFTVELQVTGAES